MYSTLAMSKDQPNFFQDVSQILKATDCNCILCLLRFATLSILHLAVLVTQIGRQELM